METQISELIESLDVAQEREVFIPSSSGEMRQAKDYKAVWNMMSNSLGCIASKQYRIIQHREVVRTLFTALDNLNIKYSWKINIDGHRIFLDVQFMDSKMTIKEQGLERGDEFIGGLRLINSYDKTTGLLVLPRLVRVVCSNGMIMSRFMAGYSIRHNQKMIEDFEGIIQKSLNEMIDSCPILTDLVNKCIGDSVEWELAQVVLLNLLRRKNHTEKIMERLQKKDKVTRWDIYNAITNYATHGEQIKPSVESWLQGKAQILLETGLSDLSDKSVLQEVIQ